MSLLGLNNTKMGMLPLRSKRNYVQTNWRSNEVDKIPKTGMVCRCYGDEQL
jgi:hypothetical protein